MAEHEPRSSEQRRSDTLDRLRSDIDLWIATAGPAGEPCLVPLSFLWDETDIIVATLQTNPTGRNLLASGTARVALGLTRDVVLIDVALSSSVPAADISPEVGDAFAARTRFDPRRLSSPYRYFRLTPRWLQAWREANEIAGRDLMRDGAWL
jgi:hypothetical protein